MSSERAASEPGVPRPGMIPLSEPLLDGREREYVLDCLDSGWVSSAGPYVTRLERWARERFSAAGAAAVASGTAALHIALLLAGVRPGDEVILPALTFIAPAYAVRYVGAHPVFLDVEPEYWQLDPSALRSFLRTSCSREGGRLVDRRSGRPVTAVVPVHVLGHPCDMDPIVELAHESGLVVVEDATESLGSLYKGRPAGLLGDIGCLSFNGNKIVTAGGGGLIVTRREELAERAAHLTTQAKDDPVEYVHSELGFNYRLTNLQAAVGLAQVERLDEFVVARRRIAAAYGAALAGVPGIELMPEAPWATSNRWLSAVLVREPEYGQDRRGLMDGLAAEGVQARPLWQPLHRSAAFESVAGGAPWVADRLHAEGLCLPSSATLSSADQARVVSVIRGLRGAARERGRQARDPG